MNTNFKDVGLWVFVDELNTHLITSSDETPFSSGGGPVTVPTTDGVNFFHVAHVDWHYIMGVTCGFLSTAVDFTHLNPC